MIIGVKLGLCSSSLVTVLRALFCACMAFLFKGSGLLEVRVCSGNCDLKKLQEESTDTAVEGRECRER